MKGRIPLGRWAGVPVGAHWSAPLAVARAVAASVLQDGYALGLVTTDDVDRAVEPARADTSPST
ncbi:hypothetical protein SUDANB95_03445 [Actinosynnema sp. ALI-1.44]